MPDGAKVSKEARIAWMEDERTLHEFHSFVVAVDPTSRVTAQNPPRLIYGIVADFDAPNSRGEIAQGVLRCGDMPPNYICFSLTPGHCRFYWKFPEPLLVAGMEDAEALLVLLLKKLKISKVLAGADETISKKGAAANYYPNSGEWEILSDKPSIPQTTLIGWQLEAAKSRKDKSGPEIPLEQVAAECDKRFPGWRDKWVGPFEFGSTGPRFWDGGADHPRGALIRATGFQCFTGPRSFVPFAGVIGAEAAERYKADEIGRAVEPIWWDGKWYWRRILHEKRGNVWHPYSKESTMLYLMKGKPQLDKGQASEALLYIEENKIIYGALPFFHKLRGTIFWLGGRRYLNTAENEPAKASGQSGVTWCEQDLGWIYRFYSEFFTSREQLDLFLFWTGRLYRSFIVGQPLQSLVLFVAGPPGRGKNLSSEISTRLFGDSIDAGDFFLSEDKFNAELFSYPLWRIDDATPLTSGTAHKKYSAIVKKVAANRDFRSRDLYQSAKKIAWMGGVIVTLNVDAESIRMLPDPDGSLLDKILVLRTTEERTCEFLEGEAQMAEIERWIPNFAQFLLEFAANPPEHVKGSIRYGCRAMQEESLLVASKQSSNANSFLEILKIYLGQYFKANPEASWWEGSATELHMSICQDAALAITMRNFSTVAVGQGLSKLKQQGFGLEMEQLKFKRQWRIPRGAEFLSDADVVSSNEPF